MWHTTPIVVFRERLIGYVLQTKSYKQKGRLKTEYSFQTTSLIHLYHPYLIIQPSFSSYWFCLCPD